MDDRNPSPASLSSSTAVSRRFIRRHAADIDAGDTVACTGKSCQSCTAGVIADCVAVCCCPCAVVNILSLAFFKLPLAVARKFIGGRKSKNRRSRRVVEERKCGKGDGISESGRVEDGISEINVVSSSIAGAETVNESFGGEFTAEEVWLELYGVGHLAFGRVSFTGVPFHYKGN